MLSNVSPPTSSTEPVLQRLQSATYHRAKRWALAVILLQAFLFLAGIVAIFVPRLSVGYPWIAFPLATVSALIATRASYYKGRAELLKRQHEFLDGLGRAPTSRELANLRAELPENLSAEVDAWLRQGITYASDKPAGLGRVLENLSESAFFSHHLAGYCARRLLALLIVSLVVSVALLLFCLHTLSGSQVAVGAAQCIAATLVFLISVGTIRSWQGFHAFSAKSDRAFAEASRLLAASTPDTCEAHRVLSEYQLARATAPLIATWVWAMHRDRLNRIWAERNAA